MTSAGFQPLRVTAHLTVGVAHASPWTCSLDGLLASVLWQDHKQANPPEVPALSLLDPPDLPLPLARCERDPLWWHWAATCGWPSASPDRPEIRYWHTRTDHRHIERNVAQLPAKLPEGSGRWKAYRMPLPITVTQSLTWHAIGAIGAVESLLSSIQAIGKKRSQGEGRVARWEVTPADLSDFAAAHLSPTGALARPTPHGCLADYEGPLVDGGDGYAGIRPPHMHPSRRTDVRLPAPYA